MYTCTYVYVYMYTCVHIHVYGETCICMNICTHIYTHPSFRIFFPFECVVKLTGTCFQTANAALQSRCVFFLVVQSCNITLSIFT